MLERHPGIKPYLTLYRNIIELFNKFIVLQIKKLYRQTMSLGDNSFKMGMNCSMFNRKGRWLHFSSTIYTKTQLSLVAADLGWHFAKINVQE